MVAAVAGLPLRGQYIARFDSFANSPNLQSVAAVIGAAECRRAGSHLALSSMAASFLKRKYGSLVESRCMVKVGEPQGFL